MRDFGIGIYRIISPSGKIYIGQTWNSRKRFSNYKNLYCKTQIKLYNSFKKYGFNNHNIEIIHELPEDVSQDIMDNYEKLYVEQYKSCCVELMNLREPGSRGKHSEESKKKMRDNWNRPIPTDKIKEKISSSLKQYYKENGPPNQKKTVQMDKDSNVLKVWESAREAAKALNITYKNISQVVNGHRPTYKGYKWKLI